jgi:8-oxo-dGTP diphosphatase
MQTKELAGVVIRNDHGELLLLHRNTDKLTQWELPGGKAEESESLEDTAAREAREELGAEVVIGEKLGNAHFVHAGIDWSYTWFNAQLKDSEPRINEPHTFDDIAYWSIANLLKKTDDISPNLLNLLKVVKG